MKRTTLLNAPVSGVIAHMGHGDRLAVVDAGMPIPPGVDRIDLAVTSGLPGFLPVVSAIATELEVEAYLIAEEFESSDEVERPSPERLASLLPDVPSEVVPHREMRDSLASCRAVVRTGETTAYANTILVSGVTF